MKVCIVVKQIKNIVIPLLIGVLILVVFYVKNTSRQPANSFLPHTTEPVYYTHRFEMELHKDTMFYPILILEGWNFVFPIFCNTWYPTCGGCIVYDNWPYPPGFPYPNYNNAALVGWPLTNPSQDTLGTRADSLLVAKEPMALHDSVTVAPSATVPTPSRWTRFKQKVRSFRIFSSS
jgi:hypothetical protein